MATRILFDPRVDLPDGSTTSSPVIVEATPTGIRANGAVVVLPTTLTFTIATAADILQLATPAASWGWKIVVYRRGTATRYGGTTAEVGSILQTRTVTWTDAPTITWQALTDLDPATLTPTTSAVASWTATAALAQQALDAVNALKAGAPGALDTFLELATQLSADETGTAALAALIVGKAPLASPTFTGTVAGITAAMVGADAFGDAAAAQAASLQKSANLTDLASASSARTALGLGTAATHPATDFDPAGAASAVTLAGLGGITPAAVAAGYQPLLPTTGIKTAAYSTAGNEVVPVDATAAGVTITLPNSPADKTRVTVKKIDASGNSVTIATAGSDVFNRAGGSVSATLSLLNQASTVQYVRSTGVWLVVASDVPLSQLDGRYSTLLTPAGSFTWNTDGTIATQTIGGVTTTFAWNPDGTLHTETRNGVTRTYTYNSDGTLGSVA